MTTAPAVSFPHTVAEHCGSGALRDLLEFHRLSYTHEPLSEAMVFGLAAGMDFMFLDSGLSFAELPDASFPPFHIWGRTPFMEEDVCAHLGIELALRHTDDPDEGWAWLRAELDDGRPTLVLVDMRELDYLDFRMQNTHHDVVVTGYDAARGVAMVADVYLPEIQRLPLPSLARARRASGFPEPVRHATYVMRFPERLPPPETAIRRAIARAVHDMTSRDRPVPHPTVGSGLDAIGELADAFPSWPERFPDDLRRRMRHLKFCIAIAGTGGALFRSLHAGFLEQAAALLSDRELGAAARIYREVTSAWQGVVAAIRSVDRVAAHAAAAEQLRRAAELERAGIEAMSSWLGGR